MTIAFVLINTEIGAEEEVLQKLKEIPEVIEAYVIYGVYDVLAKISADDMSRLKEIVTKSIRRMSKVRSTLTMIVVEGFSR